MTFSKEYVTRYGKEFGLDTWGYDFCIEDEFSSLENGAAIPLICEGYQFCAIGIVDSVEVVFWLNDESRLIDVPYSDIDEYYIGNVR